MTPKIVDREKRKNEIAFIAMDLFAEKGFDGASISDIAGKARIAKGSIYDYFRSKDELILYALSAWINLVGEEGDKRSKKIKDPVKRLRSMLTGWVEDFLMDKRMMKLSNAIFQLLMSDKVSLKQRRNFYNATICSSREYLMDIFKDGVEKGVFRDSLLKDGKELAVSIIASLDGIGLYYHINRNEEEMKKQTEIYFNYLLDSIKN